jgi:hypothetical protein
MTERGKSPDEIQRFIDSRYAAKQADRTKTPRPPAAGGTGAK